MRKLRLLSIIFSLTILAGLVLLPQDVDAQCSMCRAAITSSRNPQFIRSFNIGVLVLLVPPVSIFCSIFFILRRYKSGDENEEVQNN